MAITRTVSVNVHRADGVEVLLLDTLARVEQIVTERVKTSEIHSKIGDLEKILDVHGVRVVDGDVRGENFEDDLALRGGLHIRVLRCADDVREL